MNSTYEFTLKEGPKVKMRNFLGTKSWRKFLEGLKRKFDIFIYFIVDWLDIFIIWWKKDNWIKIHPRDDLYNENFNW